MERLGILSIICCFTIILLISCSPGETLDSIDAPTSVPIIEPAVEDGPSTTQPSNEPFHPSTDEELVSTRPQLDVTVAIPPVKEEPMPPKSSTSMSSNAAIELLVQGAIQDLAKRLDIPLEQIKLLEIREVVWPDASLGCAQPGMVYAQVLQDGLLIRLGVENQMYFYHSGESQDPFLCEETSQIIPQITPKEDEFVPPPDSEID